MKIIFNNGIIYRNQKKTKVPPIQWIKSINESLIFYDIQNLKSDYSTMSSQSFLITLKNHFIKFERVFDAIK